MRKRRAPASHAVGAPRIEWAQLGGESTRDLEGPVVQGVHCTRDPAEGEWVVKS